MRPPPSLMHPGLVGVWVDSLTRVTTWLVALLSVGGLPMKRGFAIGAAILALAAGTARGQDRDWARDQRRPRCEDCDRRGERSRGWSFRRDGGSRRDWMPEGRQGWGARSFDWGDRLRFSGPRFRAGWGGRSRFPHPWVGPHRMMFRRPMMFGRSFGYRGPLMRGGRGSMNWGRGYRGRMGHDGWDRRYPI